MGLLIYSNSEESLEMNQAYMLWSSGGHGGHLMGLMISMASMFNKASRSHLSLRSKFRPENPTKPNLLFYELILSKMLYTKVRLENGLISKQMI